MLFDPCWQMASCPPNKSSIRAGTHKFVNNKGLQMFANCIFNTTVLITNFFWFLFCSFWKTANVGKFIIIEFYSIRNFRWFNTKLFFKIRFNFPIKKIFRVWVSSKDFLMLLTSLWNKHQLLQILKAQWIKVLTRPVL